MENTYNINIIIVIVATFLLIFMVMKIKKHILFAQIINSGAIYNLPRVRNGRAVSNPFFYFLITLVALLFGINFRYIPRFVLMSSSFLFLYPLIGGICAMLMFYIKRHLHNEPNVKKVDLFAVFMLGAGLSLAITFVLPLVWDNLPVVYIELPDIIYSKTVAEIAYVFSAVFVGLLYSRETIGNTSYYSDKFIFALYMNDNSSGEGFSHQRGAGNDKGSINSRNNTETTRSDLPDENKKVNLSRKILELEKHLEKIIPKELTGQQKLFSIIRIVNGLPYLPQEKEEICWNVASRDPNITTLQRDTIGLTPEGQVTTNERYIRDGGDPALFMRNMPSNIGKSPITSLLNMSSKTNSYQAESAIPNTLQQGTSTGSPNTVPSTADTGFFRLSRGEWQDISNTLRETCEKIHTSREETVEKDKASGQHSGFEAYTKHITYKQVMDEAPLNPIQKECLSEWGEHFYSRLWKNNKIYTENKKWKEFADIGRNWYKKGRK